MDRETEKLRTLGVIGICRESYKLILAHRRIFSQITLALLIPLSFLSFLYLQTSNLISSKIVGEFWALAMFTPDGFAAVKQILRDCTLLLLLGSVYLVADVMFSFLSTSAVVYTVASAYSAKSVVSFRNIMAVVPKVWKRLLTTLLCTSALISLCKVVVSVPIFVALLILLGSDGQSHGAIVAVAVVAIIVFIVYVWGFIYIAIVWYLTNVVTVLETDKCGIAALLKSRNLVRGKKWMVVGIILVLNFPMAGVQWMFNRNVVGVGGSELGLGLGTRLVLTVIALCAITAMTMLVVLSLVMQTMVYLVCKSYHHERIHKSILLDHFDQVYSSEYGYKPLQNKNVEMRVELGDPRPKI